MFENVTDGQDNIGNALPPADELLPPPETIYSLPIVGAAVIEATNYVAPSGSPDGGHELFFFHDPDRDD